MRIVPQKKKKNSLVCVAEKGFGAETYLCMSLSKPLNLRRRGAPRFRNLLQERLTILPSHTGSGESGKLLKILTISMFDGDLRQWEG